MLKVKVPRTPYANFVSTFETACIIEIRNLFVKSAGGLLMKEEYFEIENREEWKTFNKMYSRRV